MSLIAWFFQLRPIPTSVLMVSAFQMLILAVPFSSPRHGLHRAFVYGCIVCGIQHGTGRHQCRRHGPGTLRLTCAASATCSLVMRLPLELAPPPAGYLLRGDVVLGLV